MGFEIHAMETAAGWLYRLFVTTSDTYCCGPMFEEAFLKWEREYYIRKAAFDHDSRTLYDLRSAREEPYDEGWALEVDHDHSRAARWAEKEATLRTEVERLRAERDEMREKAIGAGRKVRDMGHHADVASRYAVKLDEAEVEVDRLKGLLKSVEQCLRYLREQAGVEANDIRVALAEDDL